MKHKQKKLIYNTITVIAIVVTLGWVCSNFVHLGNVEFTENAQIKQHIIPINARVQGFVKEVRFDEYSPVKRGDTLLIIEQAEFRYRLAQAEAGYQNALADKSAMHKVISTTDANMSVSDAGIEEARIRLANAERNYHRFEALLAQNAVTRQQYDDVKTCYDAAKKHLQLLERQRQTLDVVSDEQTTRLEQHRAGIRVAEAALELARLNLSYTVITAPTDGITGRKEVSVGQLVQPGQTIVDLVDSSDKWVVANYKETQLKNIKEGAAVDMTVDAIGNATFRGRVTSISGATGSSLSLMPQDNSAGNFVKIQQRVSVRIDFCDDNDPVLMQRIAAGMNVECKVQHE